MAQEADVPKGFWARVEKLIDDKIAQFARSGFLRNASISGGNGLAIKDGGILQLQTADGVAAFYVGPVAPNLPDGSPQPGWIVRRADGTTALMMWDPRPDLDGYSQFLGWYDRAGNAVITDDTVSGLGHARPWLNGGFAAYRYQDFRYSSTSASFETLSDMVINKQQPKLEVSLRASMDTTGTTGEVQVLVNGQQLGSTTSESFAIATRYFGPAVVPGDYGDDLVVEIRGRRTSGSGALKVEPRFWRSRQS